MTPFQKKTNKKKKFEKSDPFEKKEEPFSSEVIQNNDENVCSENLQDDLLRPLFIQKITESEFNDVIIMRKILHLLEEEIESIGISNKAEKSAFNKFLGEKRTSFSPGSRSFSKINAIRKS